MTRNIYALLVGIDKYPPPVSPLKGSVNDVLAVAGYLRERVTQDGYNLHIQMLVERQATRQAIIDGFREHLCQAGNNDVAMFYYSGHGSQEESPPEFWHLEPDRLDETLVCWDSRLENGWDLADKELAQLIAEVAEKNPHIVAILDCCHSGSGTRNDLQDTTVRWVPSSRRKRPLNSFIFSLEEANNLYVSRNPEQNPSDWFVLPKGEYILLAACRDNEEAREYYGNNQYRGVFSYFLLDTLGRTNGNLTYRDLFKRTNALVRSKVTAQSPQLEATNSSYLDQPFLGGAIAQRHPYFTVSHHKTQGWVIDGGAVHGIPPVSGDETTRLAVFPFNSATEQLRQLSNALVVAEVTEVLPQLSRLNVSQDENLDPKQVYKAVVTSLPLPPLGVCIEGDEAGVTLARQAIQEASLEHQQSLYVREVAESERAEFRLLARDSHYLITRPIDGRLLVAPIVDYTVENASKAIQSLEHIARWTNIATLSTPAMSRIGSDAVKMQVYQGSSEITKPQICLEYKYENGEWRQPTCRVKLTNTSEESLYCALLNLTDRFAVSANLLPTGGIWLEPGQEAWALEGKPIYGSVPKELRERGITECKDILKLIVCTAEFDATLLQQDKLDVALTVSSNNIQSRTDVQVKSTLNRLMHRIQTRNLSDRNQQEDLWDDWVTSEVTLVTVFPQLATPVSVAQSWDEEDKGDKRDLGEEKQFKIPNHPATMQRSPVTNITEGISSRAGVRRESPHTKQANVKQCSVSPHVLNRLLIGAIALLSIAVIVLSLLLWQRSRRDEPRKLESACRLTGFEPKSL